jgi:hypothetical protein
MITRRTRFYSLAEVFFEEDSSGARADIVEHIQRSTPLPGVRCRDFYTILFDLTQSTEALFGGFTKGTRYEIRRAEGRDDLSSESWSPGQDPPTGEFVAFFNRFAAGKGLPPAPAERLAAFAAASALDLSRVVAAGDTLVGHAHLLTSERARLQHSASLFRESQDKEFRSLVGRANRWLHWRDMLRFKEQGVPVFDFGGWYHGKHDEDRLRINSFKEEFGGRIVHEYNSAVAATPRGRLIVLARRLRNR